MKISKKSIIIFYQRLVNKHFGKYKSPFDLFAYILCAIFRPDNYTVHERYKYICILRPFRTFLFPYDRKMINATILQKLFIWIRTVDFSIHITINKIQKKKQLTQVDILSVNIFKYQALLLWLWKSRKERNRTMY